MARKSSNTKQALPPRASLSRKAKSRNGASHTPPGHAALSVFSIPELLEQILLSAASDEVPNTVYSNQLQLTTSQSSSRAPWTAQRLFSLQCVSKDFHSTIHGSAKLKRLMHLMPCTNDHLESLATATGDLLPFHKPLFTVLSKLKNNGTTRLLRFNQWPGRGSNEDWHSLDVDYDSKTKRFLIQVRREALIPESSWFEQLLAQLPQGWMNPGASWRNIKICNAKDSVPLMLRIGYGDRPLEEEWDLSNINVAWHFQGHDTLGYVFDLFHQLFQHVSTLRSVIRQNRTKRAEIVQEKVEMEAKWREELKEARKVGGDRGVTSHRAIVNEQRALWKKTEKEMEAKEEQIEREWDAWKAAVQKDQNAKIVGEKVHPRSVWKRAQQA